MDGHIEDVFDFKFHVNDTFSLFVHNVPLFCLLFAVFMLEHNGRHREGLVFNPNDVFVVVFLVNGLVSCQVESKIFLFAIHIDCAHGGEPVVVSAEGIISFVVVDDANRVFVGVVSFTIDGDMTGGFEKVLFTVQRIFEIAFLVLFQRHNAVCEGRNALKCNVNLKSAFLGL